MSYFRSPLLVGGAAAMLAAAAPALAAISAGDILPIAINTAGTPSDGFALVALNAIAAGEVLYISDNELTTPTSTLFNTGESYSKWVAPAGGIAAGTVISFTSMDVNPLTVNLGTVSAVTFSGSANRGFSTTADALYFYLAASDAAVDAPTSFLSYLTIGNAADGSIPASLNANYALSFVNASGPDAAQYIGSRSSESAFADYVPLIDNIAGNWSVVSGAIPTATFNTTAFTIPAPGAVALLGLGGLIAVRRRRA